jgi:DNA polymerase-3 subunit beta
MKLTIERTALLRSLAHVQSVVERRNTIPILSNVLIDAGDGALSLVATDMDITIVERVDANVAAAGATTVPAHTLYDIVRKLPDGAQIHRAATGGRSRCGLAGPASLSQPCRARTFPPRAPGICRIASPSRPKPCAG